MALLAPITYSCINKAFATTPANASCSCATGYALVSGSCIPSCNVPATNGITTTQVTGNNGTINCTATGYIGSVAYSCASQGSNATITGSCSCSTGYSLVNGACVPITCSITSITGINNKTGLAYASSATAIPNTPTSACASGYTGSPTYTCTTTGAATIVGSCSVLYHGWPSPIGGCSTTSYNSIAPTVLGGYYPYNAGDSNACRAWKLAATVCNSQPIAYSDNNNWTCPSSGGFSDPSFGTYCSTATQYSCSTCPGLCNAQCAYNPLSLRNCYGTETSQN
jgi:hypothetical protein